MTGADEDQMPPPRAGSGLDLSRRMDIIEQKHDDLDRKVDDLAGTVARVEMNQVHQAELNKLRFDSLDTSINGVGETLGRFMSRIEAIISGEVRLPQAKAGEEMVADYKRWRTEVDEDREQQAVLNGQVQLLGRLAVILVSTNVLTIFLAIASAVNGN